MLWIITGILVSYLIGSVPTAYIFGRVLKGIDIRKFGSGNVGATNALRVLGKPAGITVLVLDVLKGFLPVVFLPPLLINKTGSFPLELLTILFGISCICGHNWTIFLQFKGGKGMATSLGVLLGLALKVSGLKIVLGLAILTWVLVFVISRIVSLASVLASIALPVYVILFKESRTLIITTLVLSAFVVLRHRGNISRLLQGKEPRLDFKKR